MQDNPIKNIELEASQFEFLNSMRTFKMSSYKRTSNCSSSQVEKGLKHYDGPDSYVVSVVSYVCVSTIPIQNNELAENGGAISSDTGPIWTEIPQIVDSEAADSLALSYAVLQVIIMTM